VSLRRRRPHRNRNTFSVGADFTALETYIDADGFDSRLPTEAAPRGYGVRPELDEDLVWQLVLRFVNGSARRRNSM
jgi:hypothetical protein